MKKSGQVQWCMSVILAHRAKGRRLKSPKPAWLQNETLSQTPQQRDAGQISVWIYLSSAVTLGKSLNLSNSISLTGKLKQYFKLARRWFVRLKYNIWYVFYMDHISYIHDLAISQWVNIKHCKSQKRVLDQLGLEFQMVIRHHAGARNWT